MKYLLMIYDNPTWDRLSETDAEAAVRGHFDFDRMVTESGECVTSAGLADPAESTSVSVRGGEVVTTDGPFVESKELLAGFYLIDCESLDRAVELAALIPDASSRAVEIRPVIDPFVGLEP